MCVCHLGDVQTSDCDCIPSTSSTSTTAETAPLSVKPISVEQQLQDSLHSFMTNSSRPSKSSQLDVSILQQHAIIKKEMSLFEGGGNRGKYLQTAYDALLTIPPSSVESERAFSAAGMIVTKLRTRMTDHTLDELVFMRAYFQKLRNTRRPT